MLALIPPVGKGPHVRALDAHYPIPVLQNGNQKQTDHSGRIPHPNGDVGQAATLSLIFRWPFCPFFSLTFCLSVFLHLPSLAATS